MLRRLGAVQLDTISVLARSHELIPYARLGAIGRPKVERAYWSGERQPGGAVEYWSHAACILPVESWPLYAFRRRHFADRGIRWHEPPPPEVLDAILARLAADGPLTSTELGGARKGGPWWDWSATKVGVEWLLDLGRVVCTRRTGWRRVYDLPERALPADVLATDTLDDAECVRRLVAAAGAALGIATVADLADYPRISRAQVTAALPDTALVPVTVEGWKEPAWADPAALETLSARGRHRTALLSPFDSLVWDRARTRRVFGFSHALEAYKPAAQREHGYFAMPLLTGGRLRGRVDYAGASTQGARAARWWPSSSPSTDPPRWPRWLPPCGRPPPGSAATPSASIASTRPSSRRPCASRCEGPGRITPCATTTR